MSAHTPYSKGRWVSETSLVPSLLGLQSPPVETDEVWWRFSFSLGSKGGRVSSTCQGQGHSHGWGIQAGLFHGLTCEASSHLRALGVLSVFIERSASTVGWVVGLALIEGV